jgi:excisionase family DNA binding protein
MSHHDPVANDEAAKTQLPRQSPFIRPQAATQGPYPAPNQPPTHYAPSGSVPGPQLVDSERRQGSAVLLVAISSGDRSPDFGTAPPCGRAPMSPRRRGRAVKALMRRAAPLCKSRRCISRLRWTANAEEMHDGSDTEFERLLSPEDIARVCGLSRRAVYRAIARGELRAVRLCHRLRIRPAELERWIGGQLSSSESRRPRRRNRPVAVSPRGSLRSMLNDADGQGGSR